MSNIEHVIENINDKIAIIEKINDLIFNHTLPIIEQYWEGNVQTTGLNLNNAYINNINNIFKLTDDIKCVKSKILNNKSKQFNNYIYFYKNTSFIKNDYLEYKKFIDLYNSKVVIFTTNHFFIKREHNKLNLMVSKEEKIEQIKLILDNITFKHSFKYTDFINNDKDFQINLNNLYLFIFNRFNNFIIIENVFNQFNYYLTNLENYINAYVTDDLPNVENNSVDKFKKLLGKYKKINPEIKNNITDFDLCVCGEKMSITPSTSDLLCLKCGSIKNLIGTVFEDSQFYSQDGSRYKHGSYIPSHHCKYWLERILAKESNEITTEHIETIKKCIKRDNIQNLKGISIDQFRKYLKETKLSKLNDHIPLIKKYITGFSPPQLSHEEVNIIYNYFDKAVKLYTRIKPDNSTNFIYYPYLLYKILELIILDRTRRVKLLSGIHLQGYTTLVNNDKKWKKICDHYSEFVYKPTDRNEHN
jgi:hypothetical protein